MASLEKQKKIKTKKSKLKALEVNTKIGDTPENRSQHFLANKERTGAFGRQDANVVIDYLNELLPSTSDTVDVTCATETISLGDKESSYDVSEIYLSVEQKEESINSTSITPSAHVCMGDTKSISVTPSVIQYPKIQHLNLEETIPIVEYNSTKSRHSDVSLSTPRFQSLTLEQLHQYYYCCDLAIVQQFEMEFLMNSLLNNCDGDPLYDALQEYYEMQYKLTVNLEDIKKLRKDAQAAQDHIWTDFPVTKTFSEKCGDQIVLKETVTYNIKLVDGKTLEVASSALTELFDIIYNSYTYTFITTKVTKFKIDQMIDELINQPTKHADGPLKLQSQLDSNELAILSELRRALSILFHFSRKRSPNKDFEKDLKRWFRNLISLHLHLASKEDHWFLLFNILRCPSGVCSWASEFIQLPCNNPKASAKHTELPLQINSPEINHCMAVLQILTMPIIKRNEYLKDFTLDVTEERWVLIDSDGEDSHTSTGECVGLKESDLIAILNQIPFEALFRSALSIEKSLDDYIIETDLITAEKVLQILAFFSQLLTLFGEGMLTYNKERYKQFAKRLARLMIHTLQYVSDYHEMFKQNNLAKELCVSERIAIEIKNLLLKACSYIYHTRNLATWQYISSLPFASMDNCIIWQIFYYLNTGFPENITTSEEDYKELINASDFWTKFNINNADSSDEDLYYLLQTFFEMANDKNSKKDWNLIETICLHIFNIGFINHHTRGTCYKAARDMLVNLTLTHENLISCLLIQSKVRFEKCENLNYLFKSLPIENWKPNMESFEILCNWMLYFHFKTAENMLARIIISNLNWSFDCDDNLFLSHNTHVRIACLISDSLTKHTPEVLGISGISESIRQVSNLMDFNYSTKEQFSSWCWSIISLLHLHIMDQNIERVKSTLRNPSDALQFVPHLERIDSIYRGVIENRPLALFLAVLLSLDGHSIPMICKRGFEFMKRLLADHRHSAVIRCLELIVPLFSETPETLRNAEGFQSVMNTLLNADNTYLQMAKDIVHPTTVGPVLELINNMIHHQITSYFRYGLSSPLNLINIWLNCLTALPDWQTSNVVFLLDKILRVAYQFPDAQAQCMEFFHNYYRECTDWKGTNKISTMNIFFGSSKLSKVPDISPCYPWLALVLLEIEFKMEDSFIWAELLRQISIAGSKPNIDTVLKKTLTHANRSIYPAQMLVLYKYANIIANMDISHALFPIINQKFFELYLWRLPLHYDEHSIQQVFGVSDKFYDCNILIIKKIKTQLKSAGNFYERGAAKSDNDYSMRCWYQNCAKLMKTYLLWLEDTTLNQISKENLKSLPQYNVKLEEIFNGETSHWTEFLYLPAIHKEQRFQADQWARKFFRLKPNKTLYTPIKENMTSTPIQRIKSHLSSYENPVPPPEYVKPNLLVHDDITQNSLKELKERIKVLTGTATKIYFKIFELNYNNQSYVENIVSLYKMVPYTEIKIKSCNSLLFNRQCTKPAHIKTNLEMIQTNETIKKKINLYRARHEKIIDEVLNENFNVLAQCIGEIRQIMRLLMVKSKDQHNVANQLKSNTGIEFFYYVIENMSDITTKFNATKQFYTELLNELAVFVKESQEREGSKVLELALKRPELIEILSSAFLPSQTSPQHFIKIYKILIDSHLKLYDTNILFKLFSKVDLIPWLETFQPKLFEINILLQLVFEGLEYWSPSASFLLQDQFRSHLIHIFKYDFPEHYGEVMQMVLNRISEEKLMPVVLLDLLNTLLDKFNCGQLDLNTEQDKLKEIFIDFAKNQNLFDLKGVTDTLKLFARHFQKERLSYGPHGLYPKHHEYCKPLSMWFSCFGHCLLVTAICTYQELAADQICDVLFGSLIDVYSPWLIIHTQQIIQQSSTNWVRQHININNEMLYPWIEQHADFSRIIINSLIQSLIFILENMPVSNKILAHSFSWYIHHFSIPNAECYIYAPIHEGITKLPWEYFKPQLEYIEMFYDSLQKFIPESHAMLGYIFIRINWNEWFAQTLPKIPVKQQTTVVSRLFTIFIKISFEPNIHVQENARKTFEDAINYSWYMVEYSELECLMKWFVKTVEPTIILQIPFETNYTDGAILDLISLACGMMPDRDDQTKKISNATAKRILYTRSVIQLQRTCATKNSKLLATKEGHHAFKNAFFKLLNMLSQSLILLADTKTYEELNRDALNIMLEIILPIQTQSEQTSNLHIEWMIEWQKAYGQPGNLLMYSTLSSIGHMRVFITGVYTLLESSIAFYFRPSQEHLDWHKPSWVNVLKLLQMCLNKLELMPIIRSSSIYTLHIFILYKMEKMPSIADQITFLQDLSQLLDNFKTKPSSELIMAIVYGSMISWGCRIILHEPQGGRRPLIMLAHNLKTISKLSEGWSKGILGAIGLKKDEITNKFKVVTRCLAIVIYSLFPYKCSDTVVPNEDHSSAMRELSMLLVNKKFNDIQQLILQSIDILIKSSMPQISNVSHLVCQLISLFYDDSLLTTVSEIWEMDFKMPTV